MANFTLMVALIIAALQVCSADPVSVEDKNDASKLFTETELQRAANIGLFNRQLIEGHAYGLTFDEMVKLHQLKEKNRESTKGVVSLAHVNEACTILIPEHKTAAEYTSDQESIINEVNKSFLHVPKSDELEFYRKYVCPFASQPSKYVTDASSFGMEVKPYLLFTYFESKNQNASGMERLKVAHKLCCIYKWQLYTEPCNLGQVDNLHIADIQTFNDLSDEEMSKFGEHWMTFKQAKTSQSFKNVCDFVEPRHFYFTTKQQIQ